MDKVLIIIPAYNEEKNLEALISSLHTKCPNYDYIIINDGSTDRTKELCAANHYNVINLPCNLGIGGAVQTGYMYAYRNGYDFAVQIDGDGQHDAGYIVAGVELLNKGYDMAIGSRFVEVTEGFKSTLSRRIGIKLISGIIKMLTHHRVKDITSGFRVCNKRMIQFFSENYEQDYPEPQAALSALCNGYKVIEYPVVMKERQSGNSSISGLKTAHYMIQVTLTLFLTYFRVKRQMKRER